MGIDVAVAGASGYAGGELLRLIGAHPDLRLVAAAAESNAGRPILELHPQLVSLADQVFAPTTPAALAAEVVFLALPHGASAALAAQLPPETLVVDLGADFRLADAQAWTRYYGGTHAGTWPYGLPELPGARERLAAARRIANPGCYPTATVLALAPLLAADLVERDGIVVVAASGTSGAGRAAKAHLLGSEVMGDVSAYRVGGTHQHIPEISQALGGVAVSFTPVLAPMPRGMLATVTAPLRPGVGEAELRAALAAAYDPEPFVHLLPAGSWPHTAATVGSNSCHLQVAADAAAGRAVVVSALDNLGKGAAGQALQNANIALGLPETTGLPVDGTAP